MDNSQLILNFLNDIWNGQELESIDRYVDPLSVIESPLAKTIGTTGKHKIMKSWLGGFPNIHYKPREVILAENKVILNWECKGRHEGVFYGIRPTGEQIFYNGITIFTVRNQLIKEYYASVNLCDILRQLGVDLGKVYELIVPKSDSELMAQLRNLKGVKLTQREIDCLSLLACSKSAKESGKVLKISHRTVEVIKSKLKSKFGVYNSSQMLDLLDSSGKHHLFHHFGMHLQDLTPQLINGTNKQ